MLAEQFLAGIYQSHRADHKTTSSSSFGPMRPTLNHTYRDCVKQNTKQRVNKSQKKTKMLSKVSTGTRSILI